MPKPIRGGTLATAPKRPRSIAVMHQQAQQAASGAGAVLGGGYIGEYIICSIFFPTQMELAFPILVAIGNLVDPPATMINSAGDYVVSYIVSRFVEGKDWLQKQLNNA